MPENIGTDIHAECPEIERKQGATARKRAEAIHISPTPKITAVGEKQKQKEKKNEVHN